jgi:hypothetical protein
MRGTIMKRSLLTMLMSLLVGLGMPWWASGAMAAALRSDDARAIQIVVQSQLNALAEDDAPRAFALATSAIRSRIGNADDFLQMIKHDYDPVYRHQRAIFSAPEIIDGNIIELVRLTDRDNRVWVAIYKMEQDNDGSWKIDGCQLLETTSISV